MKQSLRSVLEGEGPSKRWEAAIEQREHVARLIGIAVALAVMVAASRFIRWPAPGIAVAVGFGVYWLARGGPKSRDHG